MLQNCWKCKGTRYHGSNSRIAGGLCIACLGTKVIDKDYSELITCPKAYSLKHKCVNGMTSSGECFNCRGNGTVTTHKIHTSEQLQNFYKGIPLKLNEI